MNSITCNQPTLFGEAKQSLRFALALALATLALLAGGQPAFAQSVTGTIHGSVTDSTGAGMPGAKVAAINELTGETHSISSDEDGNFLFPVLSVGQYRIQAEASGFKKFLREGINLSVNRNVRVDVRLEIGEVTETVKVTGDAPLVDTRQVQLGGLVDAQRVNDLPLNGRNVYDLVGILPGVASTRLPTVQDNGGNFLNVNGSRGRHSTFMLDGGFNNDLWRNSGNQAPNPDAVQEFRVISSNFNAEFGRSPGAVINVVTKSGTNQLHGTAFEYLRNNVLNARNFFQPTVAPLRQNQFGASAGGPIIKDKTFFFGSYQGLRVRSSIFRNGALAATAAERTGDFSAAPANQRPIDPVTNQPFPGGIIPAARLDPVAKRILEFVPLPNTTDNRVQAEGATSNDDNQWLAKIDHQFSSAHKLYGSFFTAKTKSFDPYGQSQVLNFSPIETTLTQRNLIVNEDWVISPTTLNQLRFSYTRRFSLSNQLTETSWSDYGSKVKLGALPPRPPILNIVGRLQLGSFGGRARMEQQSAGLSDTLNWVRGKHNIKAGTWLLYNKFDEVGLFLASGQVQFTGSFTRNALADFMLGRAATFRQNNGTDRHFTSWNWHNFVQDDWQVQRRVTLNLGLRYELNTPFVSRQDDLQTFRFGQQSQVIPKAPLGLQFPGDQGIPRGAVKTDKNNFAPRIGIAIDPFGNGKTAIRAGYGVFYAVGIANVASDLQGQPFFVDVTVFGTPNLVDPYANVPGGSPFPYTFDAANPRFTLPITATYLNENMATPYVQHYSLTVEQQLTKVLSLQAAYVGNTSRKLPLRRDANAPVFIPGQSTAANINARRPYLPGTFAHIAVSETAANANYNSLQVMATYRFARGRTLLTSYTLSKSIDEMSEDTFNPTEILFVDSRNRRIDRGVSAFDTRHILVASYLWEFPQVKRWGFVGRHILSGWQLNGITRVQSGTAFNVTTGRDTNLDGNNNDRPNLVGNPKLSSDRPRDERIARYFDVTAFQAAPDGSVGSAGRNILYGPGSVDWNVSFFKSIRLNDRHRFQFRSEFFNFFNHTNLGNPGNSLNNANAGRILGARPARVIQFGLRYFF